MMIHRGVVLFQFETNKQIKQKKNETKKRRILLLLLNPTDKYMKASTKHTRLDLKTHILLLLFIQPNRTK